MELKYPAPRSTNMTGAPVRLVPQTGMPPINQSRSKELIYDALEAEALFIKNPFGPQLLVLSRPNHRW
jgi:hypothetical protein